MRVFTKLQNWLFKPSYGEHPHARQLEAISDLLEQNPDIERLAHEDVTRDRRTDVGRPGMSGDQVLRVLLLKQMHGMSYRAMEFHLQDSTAFQIFARASRREPWTWTTLQSNIKRLRPQTLEGINRLLLMTAKDAKIENGSKIRTDCTAVESNIHKPTDSSLLCDGVRVLTRLLRTSSESVPNAEITLSDHTKRARRRDLAITFPPKGKKRKRGLDGNYRDLLKVASKTCSYARTAIAKLENLTTDDVVEGAVAESLAKKMTSYLERTERVIDQTRRRVVRGEKVPADEKVLSIFETHTDIIVKGERDLVYGHKVCLTSGASSLILDCVVQKGNPADSTLVRPALERQIKIYGKPPRQASFDGAFASAENLRVAKEELKVEDVAFHKKCGLKIEDMTSSAWVYRRLRNFRSGIEGIISALKSGGMDRCTWRSQDSLDSFCSYVWSCVLAFNLAVIARRLVGDTA